MSSYDPSGGRNLPEVVQFSVFLDNRVGKLRGFLDLFDGTEVRVAALSVVDSADCAIVRTVLVPSSHARGILRSAKVPISETDLVVIELPSPDALKEICESLVAAEINIHYAYPLLVKKHGHSTLALHVDEPTLAASVLRRNEFLLLGEDDFDLV